MSILSDQEHIIFLKKICLEKMNNTALFSLTIKFRVYELQKLFRSIDVFFVNQLENDDTSGTKKNAVYC